MMKSSVSEREYSENLAIWRELDDIQRAELSEHLEQCLSCAERLAQYEKQDQLLAALPQMASRPSFSEVQQRLAARRSPRSAQRAWALALLVVLLLALSGGAVAASGDALPGDLLYPIKLRVEETQRILARDQEARQVLDAEIAEQRRIEAQALLSLGRAAQMDLQGVLSEIRGGVWEVSGIDVIVEPQVWQGDAPALGSQILLRVAVEAREMRALSVQVAEGMSPVGDQPRMQAPRPATEPGEGGPSEPRQDTGSNPSATPGAPVRTAVPGSEDAPREGAMDTPQSSSSPVAAPATSTPAAWSGPGGPAPTMTTTNRLSGTPGAPAGEHPGERGH